jgi:hypothetical protein
VKNCVKDAADADQDDEIGRKEDHDEFKGVLHIVCGNQQGDSPKEKKR